MKDDECKQNLDTRNFKLYNRIREINPLYVTQKSKVLVRKDIQRVPMNILTNVLREMHPNKHPHHIQQSSRQIKKMNIQSMTHTTEKIHPKQNFQKIATKSALNALKRIPDKQAWMQRPWPNRKGRPGNNGNSARGQAIQNTLITQYASWGPHSRLDTHSQDGPSDILKCVTTQDPARHRTYVGSGNKGRPAEPSISLIMSECSDRSRKAMTRDYRFIRGELNKIRRTSMKLPKIQKGAKLNTLINIQQIPTNAVYGQRGQKNLSRGATGWGSKPDQYPPSEVRTNFKSQINTSDINKKWVNQYKQLIIKNCEVFSLHTYDLGYEPLKIKEIQQKRIKSVHERNKERGLSKNTARTLAAPFNVSITLFIPPRSSSIIKNFFLNPGKRQNPTQHTQMQFNSPINICCPILKNTDISTYHGTLTPSKFDFKRIINRLSGKTYLKSNPLKKKATFQDYEYKKDKNKQDEKNILHRLIKRNRSNHSYTILKDINEEMTTQKIVRKLR